MKDLERRYSLLVRDKMVVLSHNNRNALLYRINYDSVKCFDNSSINQFIVYILTGFDSRRRPCIYVGKSKNGTLYRPLSHEDKCEGWVYCYILTQQKGTGFFNDGVIQYLEDKLNKKVSKVSSYINTTKQTTSGTVNDFDKKDCDEYLSEIYPMLFSLGLDLYTESANLGDEMVITEEFMKSGSTNNDSLKLLKEYLNSDVKDWKEFLKQTDRYDMESRGSSFGLYSKEDLYRVVFHFKNNKKGVDAHGYLSENGFVVNRGAKAAEYNYDSKDNGVKKYGVVRRSLEGEGILINGVLKKKYIFSSPLEAGVVLFGSWCTQNVWINEDGIGLGDLLKPKRKGESHE